MLQTILCVCSLFMPLLGKLGCRLKLNYPACYKYLPSNFKTFRKRKGKEKETSSRIEKDKKQKKRTKNKTTQNSGIMPSLGELRC